MDLNKVWRTIVVVDDDIFFAERMTRNFSDSHQGVVCFQKPNEALFYLSKHSYPALIVVDYRMPSMTGVEFISQLNFAKRSLKIVLCSEIAVSEHIRKEICHLGASFMIKDQLREKKVVLSLITKS
jgi:CheY-like chemotaxis protein